MKKKTKKSSEEKPEEVLQDEEDEIKNLAEKLDYGLKKINKKLNDIGGIVGIGILILSTVIAWGFAAIAKGFSSFTMSILGCITLALAVYIVFVRLSENRSSGKKDDKSS